MNKKLQAWIKGVVLVFAIAAAPMAQAELAIIAHPSVKLVGISADDLKDIYTGREKVFPNGSPVSPVDQESGTAARTQFLKNVMHMDEQELRSYWAKQLFTGKAKKPETLSDDEAVKRWVAENPDGLGYVQGKYVDGSVKVLLIVP
jgi:ABC-type phosphate transport system substrate-binding protein